MKLRYFSLAGVAVALLLLGVGCSTTSTPTSTTTTSESQSQTTPPASQPPSQPVTTAPAVTTLAVFNVSASTNTNGYMVLIATDGSAMATAQGQPAVYFNPGTIDSTALVGYLKDIGGVGVLGTTCPKSVSFGTETTITYNGETSGDISCSGSWDGLYSFFTKDVSAKLNIQTAKHPIMPPPQPLTYLVSNAKTTQYCNGVAMDTDGYRKTITTQKTLAGLPNDPTQDQVIAATIHVATTGMCQTVMGQTSITVNGGTATIGQISGWAGESITMCSCKPQVEVNLLRLPGITNVVWE